MSSVGSVISSLAGMVWVSPILLSFSISTAQSFLEPAQAGMDYQIQGEYTGMIETTQPYAAQIVALGNGQFKAIFLPGGLPGAGWNGKDRTEVPGSFQSDRAFFSGSGYSAAVLADGVNLTGKTSTDAAFVLVKQFRTSPTLNAAAPPGAVVLFDGTGVSAWQDGSASMDTRNFFKPEGSSASSGAITKQTFQSFTLHLEFREPFMPTFTGQRRGNSGIYLQGRDEVQILDSFGANLDHGLDTLSAKRECGAFWEYYPPSLNMAFPPLAWQTYDIEFTAGRYDATGKTRLEAPVATVKWNGIVVQDKRTLAYSTLLGDLPGPTPGAMRFQAYGDPVFFRNIWIVEGNTAIKPQRNQKKVGSTNAQELLGWARLDGRKIADFEKTGMRIWRKY